MPRQGKTRREYYRIFKGLDAVSAHLCPAKPCVLSRSVVPIAISHNMDNINQIKQEDLAKYMGLTKAADGTSAGNECDASGSKKMTVDDATGNITYKYRRGGVTLSGVINVSEQKIEWTAGGTTDTKRLQALREGLKLAADSDLGTGAAW